MPVSVDTSLVALFDMDAGKYVTDTYYDVYPQSRGLFRSPFYDYFGPDGRIVFNRAQNPNDYTLVVKNGKVGAINVSRLKAGGKLPTGTYTEPVPEPVKARSDIVAYPDTRVYLKGDSFDITGLIVAAEDENGVRSIVDNSKLKFYTSGTVELTQSRPFTTSGIKTVEVRYKDKKSILLIL